MLYRCGMFPPDTLLTHFGFFAVLSTETQDFSRHVRSFIVRGRNVQCALAVGGHFEFVSTRMNVLDIQIVFVQTLYSIQTAGLPSWRR